MLPFRNLFSGAGRVFVLANLAFSFSHAGPVFVNGLAIPGATGDLFGTGVNGGRLGFFSSLYYDPLRNHFWGLSDRGPGGGTISYDTRVQRFTLDINPATGAISNFQVVETILFTNGGATLNGLAPNPTNVLGNAFDPEGFVVHPTTGHFFVSDEYGPSVYEFNRAGQLVKQFTTPANLIPRNAANTPNFASDAGNVAGKRSNRGFEGLAISPDGRYVYAMLQSAMLDEGGSSGVFIRLVKFDARTGEAVAQYAYRMEGASQGRGVSALVALNDTEFLVLERNNRGLGVGADLTPPNKKVFRIDLAGATDVTGINLTSGTFTPVAKNPTPLLDLTANVLDELRFVPEKWEGLTFGPRLSDGSFLLLAGTDNDYSVTQDVSGIQFDVYFRFTDANPYRSSIQCPLDSKTGCFFTTGGGKATLTDEYRLLPGVLHAYRAAPSVFPNYVEPFATPEPATWALALCGLAGVLWRSGNRRKR
jgi:hypothetical protein